ncbi:uncharacterized protein TM35_000022350 [Trypanosoma theileri]|uniref:Uncharacterized protein n=1 Tax=Trypanosoma theileri TaxID=67003 RepID=A0A1X0P8J7_9TRYP|nr:uncharacterized protein TM35_000022350 [Trypanosoma theileri]ORC92909.1 hypothetical protein TM35_000022350 [Trypanosoma theileri]
MLFYSVLKLFFSRASLAIGYQLGFQYLYWGWVGWGWLLPFEPACWMARKTLSYMMCSIKARWECLFPILFPFKDTFSTAITSLFDPCFAANPGKNFPMHTRKSKQWLRLNLLKNETVCALPSLYIPAAMATGFPVCG